MPKWKVCAAAALLLCTGLPLFAQEDREDDPNAREQYLIRRRGGPAPAGARLRAMEDLDRSLQQQGQEFRQNMAAIPGFSIASNPSSWTFIGPEQTTGSRFISTSGRVSAIAVDPTDSNIVYAGGAQGGVWKTTDAGSTWLPLTDDQASLAIGSLAIDPNHHNTIYAGTGEQNFSSDSYYGAGILKSTDAGASWTRLTNPAFDGSAGKAIGTPSIGAMAVQPGVPTGTPIVLAAVRGGAPPGLYYSTDGGSTWNVAAAINALNGGTGASVNSLVYVSSSVVYAGVFRNGVYKSTDGGITWVAANGSAGANPLPASVSACPSTAFLCRTMVGASPHNVNVVYVSVSDGTQGGNTLGGVFKTSDGGLNWTKLGPGVKPGLVDFCSAQCWYDQVVAVNPANENQIFLGGSAVPSNTGTDAVLYSSDGGNSWTSQGSSTLHVDHHAASFSLNGSILYWGTDGGVYNTVNTSGTMAAGAVTWTNLNSDLGLTQFYGYFAIHPTDPSITYAGAQDNGTQKYSGSLSWLNLGPCGDGAGAVVDVNNPLRVFANCQNVDVHGASDGASFCSFTNCGGPAGAGADRVEFIPPMVGDGNPSAVNRIYFGTYRVWMKPDSTSAWIAASGDLTAGTGSSNVIFNMAVAPSDKNTLYVVTEDARVQRSTSVTSATATTPAPFSDITGTGLSGASLNAVAVDPSNAAIAYVVESGFGHGHVYKLSAGSSTWANISGNLPDTPVNDVVVDPDLANTLYVGTDIGVYRTTDGGASWAPLANGLPRVAVFGLKLHRPSRTLRAATHGRGMWDLSVPTAPVIPTLNVLQNVFFASQMVNSVSTSQTLTLTAQGGSITNVNIGPMTDVNSGGDFARTHDCAATVSATCTVNITFSPIAVGTRTATVTITSTDPNSPQTINITGNGHDANLTLMRPLRPSRVVGSGGTAVMFGQPAQVAVSLESTEPASDAVTFECDSGSPGVRCDLSRNAATLANGSVPLDLKLVATRKTMQRSSNHTAVVTAHIGTAIRNIQVPYTVSPSKVRSKRLTPGQ